MAASRRIAILCTDMLGGPGAEPKGSAGLLSALLKPLRKILSQRQIVYGASTAYRSFNTAMLHHSTAAETVLISYPSMVQRLHQQLKSTPLPKGSAAAVCNYFDVAAEFKKGWYAWFDDTGNFCNPFDLRANFASSYYPILFSHHTVSYQHQLNNRFLPLILAETQPCDSFVCTSYAARRLVDNQLQHISHALERSHGLHASFRGRLDVIPLGVDTEVFSPRPKDASRKHFGFSQKETLILYFGRISVIDKGDLFPLAQAFAELRRRNPDEKLTLAISGRGHKGYDQLLKEKLKEAGLSAGVVFLPGITDEELPLLYSAADIFVSPSDNIQECFGQTPLEAMACGVPQVVSDWDGYRETVANGETGFLIPTYWMECDSDLGPLSQVYAENWQADHFRLAQSVAMDNRALVESMEVLVRHPELRAKMGEASRRRAVSLFSWKKIVSDYHALADELRPIAESIPYRRPAHASYRQPEYFRFAQHFASTILNDATVVVRSTGAGSGEIFVPYAGKLLNMTEFHQWNVAQSLAFAEKPISVGKLAAQIARSSSCSEVSAKRQIMWLMKYSHLVTVN
ncbi:glycosyltransferase family 4 protein [Silvibacterium sp.]|uniref:glycosyltransferase family 4 protein n=1 Tax=Silvibacterium sp. TaxID=1964179 RepID=UPI0039E5CAC9